MNERRTSRTVTVDGYTRFCLTAIVVLLTLLIIGLWADGPQLAREAAAVRPAGEAGTGPRVPIVSSTESAQRDKMISGIQGTNQRLDKLIRLLESGKLKVVVANLEGGDDKK